MQDWLSQHPFETLFFALPTITLTVWVIGTETIVQLILKHNHPELRKQKKPAPYGVLRILCLGAAFATGFTYACLYCMFMPDPTYVKPVLPPLQQQHGELTNLFLIPTALCIGLLCYKQLRAGLSILGTCILTSLYVCVGGAEGALLHLPPGEEGLGVLYAVGLILLMGTPMLFLTTWIISLCVHYARKKANSSYEPPTTFAPLAPHPVLAKKEDTHE